VAVVSAARDIDDLADAAPLILIHPIWMAPIDTKRGSGGDQTLNVEKRA
jgi:hypothetical protein